MAQAGAPRLTDARYTEPGGRHATGYWEASLKGGSGGDTNVYFLGDLALYVDEYDAETRPTL